MPLVTIIQHQGVQKLMLKPAKTFQITFVHPRLRKFLWNESISDSDIWDALLSVPMTIRSSCKAGSSQAHVSWCFSMMSSNSLFFCPCYLFNTFEYWLAVSNEFHLLHLICFWSYLLLHGLFLNVLIDPQSKPHCLNLWQHINYPLNFQWYILGHFWILCILHLYLRYRLCILAVGSVITVAPEKNISDDCLHIKTKSRTIKMISSSTVFLCPLVETRIWFL